ncbi:MAG: chemotaxis protein CheW [Terrimicrobiaceae bacterium]|jgi:purine-binding chemotaxis protein CheW
MEKVSATPSESSSRAALAGKYLTFALSNEAYGIPVLKVREIITMLYITMVPQMPPYVKGVINLRGKVIPVIDLRAKLGLPKTEITDSTCIVVVQISVTAGEVKHIGLIVDAVEEVANVAGEDIEPAPDFGGSIEVSYILGMAKIKGEVKSLLDIDKVIAADEIKPIGETFAAL